MVPSLMSTAPSHQMAPGSRIATASSFLSPLMLPASSSSMTPDRRGGGCCCETPSAK
nr:TPA_asm: m88.5 sORF 2 [Murid betaherpesvirus 1]DBA08034.1 TPA_asm: m88.5 sORF 2 [Murid betaherpesvirus 1]